MVATVIAGLLVLGLFMIICFGDINYHLNELEDKLETLDKIQNIDTKVEYEVTDVEEEDGGYTVHIQTID